MAFTAFGPIYKATVALLPPMLDTPSAKAMLIAIAMQESRWDERRQIGGPAHGFFQFELAGVRGVLTHKASSPIIRSVLDRLDYDHKPGTSYVAIEHNDVLAFAYARCLLWTLPGLLPFKDEPDEGWQQYLEAWRPGKPRRASWNKFFEDAWKLTTKGVTP